MSLTETQALVPLNNSHGDPNCAKGVWRKLTQLIAATSLMLGAHTAWAASMEFESVGSAVPNHGVYAGLYELEIDGNQVFAMCDDYTTHIAGTWTATQHNYSSIIDSNNGKFHIGDPTGDDRYHQAGYLFNQVVHNPTTSTDKQTNADLNFAVWAIMDPTLISGAFNSWWSGSDAKTLHDDAVDNAGSFDFSNIMVVYTPDP